MIAIYSGNSLNRKFKTTAFAPSFSGWGEADFVMGSRVSSKQKVAATQSCAPRVFHTMSTQNEKQPSEAQSSGVELPPGVKVSDWAEERALVQNPRIRSFLGCTHLLEEVLDSNYALLHCSRERLLKVWRQVQQVCELMRSELAPTLEAPSVIPDLETARRRAHTSFQALTVGVIAEIERYPEHIPAAQLHEVRELLCVSIGKIYAFLRDTFGEVVASDPRSQHDADYFLSRRFARDIEESEWLYSLVYELCGYLDGLDKVSSVEFKKLMSKLRTERMVPHETGWERTKSLLETLQKELTSKLRDVLTVRGIRFDDMKTLEAYALDISHRANNLNEVYAVGRAVVANVKRARGTTLAEREQSVKDLISCHEAISARMIELTSSLNGILHDLATYVPAWMAGIENRRALALSKIPAESSSDADIPSDADGLVRTFSTLALFDRRPST